jgi:hypothetical protein
MQMSAILGKAKPDTENIRRLNLAAVKSTTVQVSRLLLQRKLWHDLLYWACADRGLVYIAYT